MSEHRIRGAFGDHGAEFESDHAVTDRSQERHVVLDHENRATGVLADTKKQRPEGLCLLLGHAAGRLVEHQHAGFLGKDAREVDDSPRPGREFTGQLLTEGIEVHELDQLIDPSPAGQLGLIGRRQLQRGRHHVAIGEMAFERDGDRLGDRQAWK